MVFGWIQLAWFGDKLNCQKTKLLTMHRCAKHRPYTVMLIKMGKFFAIGCKFFFSFLSIPNPIKFAYTLPRVFNSIFVSFLSVSFQHTDSSMIIPIFRPITLKFRHLVKRRVNAAVPGHQHRMQRPHSLEIPV